MKFRARTGRLFVLAVFAVTSLAAAAPETAFVDAAKRGDVAAVRALLKKGQKVNVAGTDGTTALHWAAHRKDATLMEVLLRAGADVKAANRYGATPLSLAAAHGHAAVIERLLKAGADPNTASAAGETVLMTVARTGSVAAIDLLVARGADVNAREATRGQTALMWAAAEGHADAVSTLLKAGAELNARSKAPAGAAMTMGDSTYRRSVARIDVFTPFMFAVRAGRIGAARVLVAAGADPNETLPDGTSALVVAIHNAQYDMASFLLDRGADPNAAKQGWTPVHQLIRTRNLNIGFFPHPEALSQTTGIELAKTLIAKGADVNARMTRGITDGYRNFWNQRGVTPFLLAAKGADLEMLKVLAASGADPHLANASGTTPLMAASGVEMFNPNEDSGTNEEAVEAVKFILTLDADVNKANSQGEAPLHGAAWRGANEIIRLLVDKGARLDAKSKVGSTPLMIANGEEERVANINVRPWTVEFLVKLMQERGIPIEMNTSSERLAFEKIRPAPERRRGAGGRGGAPTPPATTPTPAR